MSLVRRAVAVLVDTAEETLGNVGLATHQAILAARKFIQD